jgi:hypothetical protein
VRAKIYPVTPNGRYFVVRRRLWRRSNPFLPEQQRTAFVDQLVAATRAVGRVRDGDKARVAEARAQVDPAKTTLGRGPVWWQHGTPDLNRHPVDDRPYATG